MCRFSGILQTVLDLIYSFVFAAMWDTGIGSDHVNRFLGDINLPGIHHKSLRRREKEVLHHLEDCSRKSCKKAMEEEIRLSVSDGRYTCIVQECAFLFVC